MGITIRNLKKKKKYLNFINKHFYTIIYFEDKKIFKFKRNFFKENIINKNVSNFCSLELNINNIYYFNFYKKKINTKELEYILLNNFINKNNYLTEYIYTNNKLHNFE